MTEVAWFTSPPDATLAWTDRPRLGHLMFIDPNGKLAAVPVTLERTADAIRGEQYSIPVWHIDVDDQGRTAVVSPSIHFVGRWHSPNPVHFRLVDELSDPTRERKARE